MPIYRSRAPLRLGLAGGGTDVSPFSNTHGGFVLNATIDLYAQAILEPLNDGRIVFAAEDREENVVLEAEPILLDDDPLRLHRGIYNRIVKEFNNGYPLSFKLTTFADAPAGSGLGTSSTMVVCIIQAFSEWLGLSLGEYDIAHLAFEIEREELLLTGGKQDQYAAAFGGFNFIEFGPGNRVLVNPLRIKEDIRNELEASTILYYTGQSRDSAKIIEQQILSSQDKESRSLNAMFALKQDAIKIKEAVLRGDLAVYADILRQSWEAKKNLAKGVSNSELDMIFENALKSGALAGKLSGAGGGGFFMFFVPPAKRMRVLRELRKHGGEVMNFHFTSIGSQSWVQY
ncbi:GHMP kinase [Prosthecochloris aestuarii DSM 271]|uniref:GHMP kinase n=1 Tax=Prosthecochloris aestuarii (strain DSM 271 / SK 413) TaxID=290512 RepID=B4S3M1_PROA2|nr:dehydrogenase [Prosthecochloris aestuarii]ACF46760.1 GHMP kinase [Prosthecochloris aestuarii DSM 271]